MARPPDTKSKRIHRRAVKAVNLIDSGIPKMKAYRLAGIPQKTFWNWKSQVVISEHAVRLAVEMRNAQAQ